MNTHHRWSLVARNAHSCKIFEDGYISENINGFLNRKFTVIGGIQLHANLIVKVDTPDVICPICWEILTFGHDVGRKLKKKT